MYLEKHQASIPVGLGGESLSLIYEPFKPHSSLNKLFVSKTLKYTVCRCFSFDLRIVRMCKYRVDNITLFTGVPTSGGVPCSHKTERPPISEQTCSKDTWTLPDSSRTSLCRHWTWFFPHPTTASKRFLKDHTASWNIRIKWWWLKCRKPVKPGSPIHIGPEGLYV